jgi:hypothetical protein
MISPRLARRIAQVHKWLGLIVGIQLVIWTSTGLFFTSFAIADIHGDHLRRAPEQTHVDVSRVKLSTTDALRAVVEDHPSEVILKSVAGEPVYEIRAQIGVFLVSAETGAIISPVPEEAARTIATSAWLGSGKLLHTDLIDKAPREAGLQGQVWAAHFEGKGHPIIYVSATNGDLGPVRTDLWRTYDFLWSLHIMDYDERENFHHPLIIAAAILALSTVLFGVALLLHRFTRGLIRPPEKPPSHPAA